MIYQCIIQFIKMHTTKNLSQSIICKGFVNAASIKEARDKINKHCIGSYNNYKISNNILNITDMNENNYDTDVNFFIS